MEEKEGNVEKKLLVTMVDCHKETPNRGGKGTKKEGDRLSQGNLPGN